METILELLENTFLQSILYAMLILLIYVLLRKRVMNIFFRIINKRIVNSKTKLDDILLKVVRKPIRMLMNVTVLYIAYHTVDLHSIVADTTPYDNFALHCYSSAVIVFFFMVLYNSTDESHVFFTDFMKVFDIEVDKLLIPFVSKVFRLFLFIVAVAVIAETWGFSVGTFVAGLGIGGLAFALAAQDTLSNLFGGAVIITEKPFTLGDWIIVDDVEGTVEDINFRSTKIRKFNKSVVTVPNSRVADANIINFSKRDIRRISYELKIHIDSSVEEVKAVVANIEKMLTDHKDIDNETIFVKFNKFGESSLNIFLYYFTSTSDWGKYLTIAEDTNFRIMKILEENNVTLAVPLQQIKMTEKADS
jgi:MscS family membrane protein